MNCPVCKHSMVVLELDQVEIDHCPSCGGVWLDAGELELLLEGAPQRDRLLASFETGASAGEKKIRCPICSKKMDKVLCGVDKRVRVDRCRENDGIWFDKGELGEILEMGYFHADRRVLDLLDNIFKMRG